MKMTDNFTPGPWHSRGTNAATGLCMVTDDSNAIVAYTTLTTDPDDFIAGALRGTANARLIAAAPDMLAALKQIIRYADGSTDPAILSTARAAIAKATNRADAA